MLSTSGAGDSLLESVTDFINLMLAGRVPERVRPILFGGRLTALKKKYGGLRPIAIGYTWRRLAAKVCCKHVSERAAALLSPRQLGFGVQRGAEGAAHATRCYFNNLTEDKIIIKIDFSNAFNTLRRDTILEAVQQYFPELLPYICELYIQ